MRLGTFEADRIQDLTINLEPRVKYQLTGKQLTDPAMIMAAIAGDPDIRPEGYSQE